MTGREILIYLSLLYKGNYQQILEAITNRIDFDYVEAVKAIKTIKSNVITILDSDYPEYLKCSYMPPLVLFYYGDISLINDENYEKNLAVIGSRECTKYGVKATNDLISGLKGRINIVSGLAYGIDGVAHSMALKSNAKTIAVLGSGIDYIYPEDNKDLYILIKKKGLVLSEYPNDTPPDPSNFPNRNRIIAHLSKAVLVTEAKRRSGTSITVRFALEGGKSILCVPYPYNIESFCNDLIDEGARLTRSSNDILDEMKYF